MHKVNTFSYVLIIYFLIDKIIFFDFYFVNIYPIQLSDSYLIKNIVGSSFLSIFALYAFQCILYISWIFKKRVLLGIFFLAILVDTNKIFMYGLFSQSIETLTLFTVLLCSKELQKPGLRSTVNKFIIYFIGLGYFFAGIFKFLDFYNSKTVFSYFGPFFYHWDQAFLLKYFYSYGSTFTKYLTLFFSITLMTSSVMLIFKKTLCFALCILFFYSLGALVIIEGIHGIPSITILLLLLKNKGTID